MASSKKRKAPALTPEARESQLISLAVNLAEKQLAEGTASAQVITHFLKLGTVREQLEKQKLINENALLAAKTESIQSQKSMDELYSKAINAMKMYSGNLFNEDGDSDEVDI